MRWLYLILFEIVLCNLHFLFANDLSVYELQPIPLLVLSVFLLMKLDEQFLFQSLIITGVITDIFYNYQVGAYTSIYLISGFLLVESRNMLFRDHFMTHVIFVFIISFVGILVLYIIDGTFTIRAPLFIAIYNAILTPVLYSVFELFKLKNVINKG